MAEKEAPTKLTERELQLAAAAWQCLKSDPQVRPPARLMCFVLSPISPPLWPPLPQLLASLSTHEFEPSSCPGRMHRLQERRTTPSLDKLTKRHVRQIDYEKLAVVCGFKNKGSAAACLRPVM